VAQFRKGAEAVQAAAQRKGGGKYAPILRWEGGEKKYIQFLDSMDEIITVLMHQWIIVGQREDGRENYERFISRRDPMLDGADGYDELIERFGVTPTERSIALVVEVEPAYSSGSGRKKIEGFDLAERQYENKDGETITVPNFGLIIESPKTFFNTLAEYNESAPIDEVIYEVKRLGESTDTAYVFIPTDFETLDVEEELDDFEFDFEAWLDELADEDRMREIVGAIPTGAKVSRYGGKGKGKDDEEEKDKKKSTRRSGTASTRRSRAKVEEEPEDAEDAKDDDANANEDEDAKSSARSRRFKGLRETATKKK